MPAKRLEVQLAWSEFKNDSWAAKKTSANAVTFRDVISALFENLPTLPGLGRSGIKRLFTFRTSVTQANQLTVHCDVALPTSLLDPSKYNSDDWLSEPKEIGHFRFNACSRQLDAVDTKEKFGFIDLFSQATSQMLIDADEAIAAPLKGDRQLQQRGAPITPDDDPKRPSKFRASFKEGGSRPRLPHHSVAGQEDDYRLLARHQESNDKRKHLGFFYQDESRAFFCFPWLLPKNNPGGRKGDKGHVFFPFYHPYSCALLENIQRAGIPGIYHERYALDSHGRPMPSTAPGAKILQVALQNDSYFRPPDYAPIDYVYNPPDGVRALRPIEEINFSTIGAYAEYNWEIFFHIPLLIASRLSTNQKFREAQHWFHYIFNPTDATRRRAGEVLADAAVCGGVGARL